MCDLQLSDIALEILINGGHSLRQFRLVRRQEPGDIEPTIYRQNIALAMRALLGSNPTPLAVLAAICLAFECHCLRNMACERGMK